MMHKSRFWLLLCLPAAWFAAESIFLVGENGYYKTGGVIGLVPLALALLAAYLLAHNTDAAAETAARLGSGAGAAFAAAAVARLLFIAETIGSFGEVSGVRSATYIVMDSLRLITGVCASVCFVMIAAACFRGKTPETGFLALPAAACFLIDMAAYFVRDPINSANVVSQRTVVALCLIALYIVSLLGPSGGGMARIRRKTAFLALLALGYCLPGLIQALALGGRFLDVFPCLVYTLLTLFGFNITKKRFGDK